jgi:hypothetical protein
MDNQTIFNKAVVFLLGQGRKSIEREQCLYRGPEGTACGVGLFIKDEFYSPKLEGYGMGSESVTAALLQSIGEFDGGFMLEIQTVHDEYSVEEWPHRFRVLAAKYDLHLPPELQQ